MLALPLLPTLAGPYPSPQPQASEKKKKHFPRVLLFLLPSSDSSSFSFWQVAFSFLRLSTRVAHGCFWKHRVELDLLDVYTSGQL